MCVGVVCVEHMDWCGYMGIQTKPYSNVTRFTLERFHCFLCDTLFMDVFKKNFI